MDMNGRKEKRNGSAATLLTGQDQRTPATFTPLASTFSTDSGCPQARTAKGSSKFPSKELPEPDWLQSVEQANCWQFWVDHAYHPPPVLSSALLQHCTKLLRTPGVTPIADCDIAGDFADLSIPRSFSHYNNRWDSLASMRGLLW